MSAGLVDPVKIDYLFELFKGSAKSAYIFGVFTKTEIREFFFYKE